MSFGQGIGSFADGFRGGYSFGNSFNNKDSKFSTEEKVSEANKKFETDQTEDMFNENARRGEEIERDISNRLSMQLNQSSGQQGGGGGGMGMSPAIASKFMGGGAGGGAASGGGAAAGGGSAAGGSAAGGGGGSALAAAGPWAALAAVVVGNEREAIRGGYRDEDEWEYAKDLFGGKVLSQDINERWAPKMFGKDDKLGLGADMEVGGEVATLDFSNAWDKLKDGTVAKAIKKIF